MSRPVLFLSVEHLLAIHARVIREFGGDGAVRDWGLLESAAAMPAARFAGKYLHRTIGAMAGAYLFHLCKNHAFVDGNKRVALAAAEVFVLLNGRRLKATNAKLERLTMAVADGSMSKDEVMEFFIAHVES